MAKKIFEWVLSPMGRIAVLIVALSVFTLAAFGIYWTQQPLKEQPIAFRHDIHVNLGVQCLYCHPGALRGPSPGLPTQNKCWGCHQQIAKTQTSERLAVLVSYVENDKPIGVVTERDILRRVVAKQIDTNLMSILPHQKQ